MAEAIVCWFAIVFALALVFGIGLLLGRLSERLSRIAQSGIAHRKEQGPEDEFIRMNCQHNDPMKDLQAGDIDIEFWRQNGEERLFYVSKGGGKVHLSARCRGLNGSAPEMRTLCKFCKQQGIPERHGSAKKKNSTRGKED